MRDANAELLRALASRAGLPLADVQARTWPWMSATFAGMRHEIVLALPPERIAPFCAGIGEAEFVLHGHIVADILAEPIAGGARVAALSIADCG